MDGGERESMSLEAAARQNLQQRLLDSVKQCQIHFGARQEMATESDARVATLCVEWEEVLLHGMKRAKSKAPLKQITGSSRADVSLWPLAQLCLGQQEVRRFLLLPHLTSDTGRGRAWLRAAINERTIENYIHLILAEESKLRSLYEPRAYLLDQERSSMLPVMAAGLNSILFSITVDADYLNSPTRSVDVPPEAKPLAVGNPPSSHSVLLEVHVAPQQNAPETLDAVVAVNKKKKRRKTPIPNGHTPSPSSHRSTCAPSHEKVAESELPAEQQAELAQEVGVVSLELGQSGSELGGTSVNLSSSSSMVSLMSDSGPPTFVALDTSMLGNQSSSEAEAEAAVSATAFVLSATNSQSSSPPHPTPRQAQVNTAASSLSPKELREALLAMVKAKDELEVTNRQLTDQVDNLQAERDKLQTELSQTRVHLTSLRTTYTAQQSLERENDLLKDQLKKMVQRRDSSYLPDSDNGFVRGLEEAMPSDPTSSSSPPTAPQPSSEDKLSKMADMYGEIMEHNDRLQRELALKDGYISRLLAAIRGAGLPVPSPAVKQKEERGRESASPDNNLLVNVWIPSVIKRGRGPDAHHIYQVFIRVKEQEWNVYRRYAEFREFHKQLQQCIPEAASFQFPPKKTLGNKSAQVVEERRVRLQEYLRYVVQLCTEPRAVRGREEKLPPIVKSSINRDTLLDILPFFRDDMHTATPSNSNSGGVSYSGL